MYPFWWSYPNSTLGSRKEQHAKHLLLLREAQDMLTNIAKSTVCFYPAANSDFAPLPGLAHLCDTFVLCDWQRGRPIKPDEFTQDSCLAEFDCESVVELDPVTVSYLSDRKLLPDDQKTLIELGNPVAPWGNYTRLVRKGDKEKRSVHLFYFGIEGFTLFFNLFFPDAPPKVLCFFNEHGNWTTFCDGKKDLGELVKRGCSEQPQYVVGSQGNWGYTREVEKLTRWGGRDNPDSGQILWALAESPTPKPQE